jgi:hypothetical protein
LLVFSNAERKSRSGQPDAHPQGGTGYTASWCGPPVARPARSAKKRSVKESRNSKGRGNTADDPGRLNGWRNELSGHGGSFGGSRIFAGEEPEICVSRLRLLAKNPAEAGLKGGVAAQVPNICVFVWTGRAIFDRVMPGRL